MVGIAIGFGAQTVVRNIVFGIFLLAADAFRVGEHIDVGKARSACATTAAPSTPCPSARSRR